jgi:hypothetical protein
MRHTALLVAALVVVGFGAPAVVASLAAAPADVDASSAVQEADGNETANESEPGARLAGVVNVQSAEVEGEVAERSFGLQMAAANSNASKAAVLANQTGDLTERIDELRERKQALEERRADGDISNGRYRAEMARVAAELSTANRLLNRTTDEAERLPPSALTDAGVNATNLQRLREAAGELSGPEMAEIARDISGPPVNRSVGPPENGTQGPPQNVTTTPGGTDVEVPSGNSTRGPPGNGTEGPQGNDVGGPPENVTQGPLGNDTQGPPRNATQGPFGDVPSNVTGATTPAGTTPAQNGTAWPASLLSFANW